MALCVHPDLKYVKVEDKSRSKTFILCEKLLTTLFKDPKKAEKDGKCVIVDRFDGKAMVGWEYEPLFNFYDKKDVRSIPCCLKSTADRIMRSLGQRLGPWLPIHTSVQMLAQASYTKHLRSAKTIIALHCARESFPVTRRLLSHWTKLAFSLPRSPLTRACT